MLHQHVTRGHGSGDGGHAHALSACPRRLLFDVVHVGVGLELGLSLDCLSFCALWRLRAASTCSEPTKSTPASWIGAGVGLVRRGSLAWGFDLLGRGLGDGVAGSAVTPLLRRHHGLGIARSVVTPLLRRPARGRGGSEVEVSVALLALHPPRAVREYGRAPGGARAAASHRQLKEELGSGAELRDFV